MNFKNFLSVLFAAALLLVSCRNDDPVDQPKGAYEDGIFIANEGNFGSPNARVDFVSNDLNYTENDIYKAVNKQNLGDVLQHINFNGDDAYLVLNNSNKVTVVDRYTFAKKAEITDQLNNPRYITFASNYIYVTNDEYQGEKYVAIYNASNNSFVKKLPVNTAAERIVTAGGNVFVQNSTYGFGNTISYITPSTNTVQSEITVPEGQIQKIISDGSHVYAITSDYGLDHSYIYQISSAGAIAKTTTLSNIASATNLVLSDGDFYFSAGNKVYKMSQNATAAPTTPLITVEENPYSMLYGFDVIDGKIFTADASGFTADSKITVYNTSGGVIKTLTAGRGTNGFYKN